MLMKMIILYGSPPVDAPLVDMRIAYRSCRIEGVARTHAYALIGMFTRDLEPRSEAAAIGNSASSFVSRARRSSVYCRPITSLPRRSGTEIASSVD